MIGIVGVQVRQSTGREKKTHVVPSPLFYLTKLKIYMIRYHSEWFELPIMPEKKPLLHRENQK